MADENINLIRFSDISNMTALNEKTVSYQITLDNRIDGSPNNPLQMDEFVDLFFKILKKSLICI